MTKGIPKCPNCDETMCRLDIALNKKILDINHVNVQAFRDLEDLLRPHKYGSVSIYVEKRSCLKCGVVYAILYLSIGSKSAYVYLPLEL